ncbi:uncharacterized protein MELLADRAFT_107247 [Melampsora larici-populina 98AG31]|uniref:Uncharacterized protein n=1 Tax=Melampsora larici-populina (strain 98AG31 / pathotype 3-4-7) TaxID=747676 RepID=F4RPB5_MELLP|nr:uncharacterized protein MELLADRAFT_107247 [Melampsora larici-populina 98AG31]EGG05878.1 hypothetical protein MELLADRAFT_107247 [Melampsora larici-populina 98AG31]
MTLAKKQAAERRELHKEKEKEKAIERVQQADSQGPSNSRSENCRKVDLEVDGYLLKGDEAVDGKSDHSNGLNGKGRKKGKQKMKSTLEDEDEDEGGDESDTSNNLIERNDVIILDWLP